MAQKRPTLASHQYLVQHDPYAFSQAPGLLLYAKQTASATKSTKQVHFTWMTFTNVHDIHTCRTALTDPRTHFARCTGCARHEFRTRLKQNAIILAPTSIK